MIDWIRSRIREADFITFLGECLLELCRFGSIPTDDLEKTALQEKQVFDTLKRALGTNGLGGVFIEAPISREIERDGDYTFPYYTRNRNAYNGRFNLLHRWRPEHENREGKGIALNAHVDTVAPFFEPRLEGNILSGRGACDDKGGCAAIIGAHRLLKEIGEKFQLFPGREVLSMFVIDEETGGNGSLSITLNDELRTHYQTLIVLEPTNLQLHPANRGAVWYQIEIDTKKAGNPILLALEIVHELEEEGDRLKNESRHPLFPGRPVQTCNGVLGPFGDHPSGICGQVAFRLHPAPEEGELGSALQEAVRSYTARYGDKTKVIDGSTGLPKIERHYAVRRSDGVTELTIFGSTGHMGAIQENDNAITKSTYLMKAIAERFPAVGISFTGRPLASKLVVEGGQGFLPSHSIEEVKKRIKRAVDRGFESHVRNSGAREKPPAVRFNKLHNDAFAQDPDSAAFQEAMRCAEKSGIQLEKPVVGFSASCDARLFANKCPDLTVLTTGPGRLEHAHSNGERIGIDDIAACSAFLSLYILAHTNGEPL